MLPAAAARFFSQAEPAMLAEFQKIVDLADMKATGLSRYRDGQGLGLLHHWVNTDHRDISVQEFYVIIPYASHMLVFITASEDELPRRRDD